MNSRSSSKEYQIYLCENSLIFDCLNKKEEKILGKHI